jgi:hypothetical protein
MINKGYGPGWQASYGKFSDWKSADGELATAACCACGGGEEMPAQVRVHITIANLDYNALSSLSTVLAAFNAAVKGVASKFVGLGVLPEYIDVAIDDAPANDGHAAGTTVRIHVRTPQGGMLEQVQEKLLDHGLGQQVIDGISKVPSLINIKNGKFSVAHISNPTIPGFGDEEQTRSPTVEPTPAPTEYPVMGAIPYLMIHRPPYRDDEWGGDSYIPDNIMQDSGSSWLGPDQRNQENSSMYFIFDLDHLHYVGELAITNGWDGFCSHYFVTDYRISMGDDGEVFGYTVAGALEPVGSSQRAPVGFTARYLKFEALTYGVSAGLTQLFIMGN